MKSVMVEIIYQHKGTRYERSFRTVVDATSVRSAISKALAAKTKKDRPGWKEPSGALFTLRATVLGSASNNLHAETEEKTDGEQRI